MLDAGQYEAVFIISDDEVTDAHLPISVGVVNVNDTQNMPIFLFVFASVLLVLFFGYKRYLR